MTALKARAFASRLDEQFNALAVFPNRGRRRDELSAGYRSLPVPPFVIMYRVADENVEILRVVDGRRDFGTIFG